MGGLHSSRRRIGRVIAALVVVVAGPAAALVAIAAANSPVAAQSIRSVGGSVTGGSPEAIVIVSDSGVIASWRGGSGPRWTCGYFPIEAPFANSSAGSRSPFGVTPVEGMAYVLSCDDESGHMVHSRLVVFTPADPLGGVAIVERVVAEARRRIELAAPVPRSNPFGVQLVGLATWLWVTDPWFEQQATASVGGVSATVHAVPVGVDWDTGDGGHVLCDRGVPYDLRRSPRAQSSSCTHVFQRSSAWQPGGVYELSATERWVAWWSSSTGEGGSLGLLSRTTTMPIRVVELQALVD